jgi:hypothetical protein
LLAGAAIANSAYSEFTGALPRPLIAGKIAVIIDGLDYNRLYTFN